MSISNPQIILNRLGCAKKNDRNEINSGGSPRLTMHLRNHLLITSGYPFGIASVGPGLTSRMIMHGCIIMGTFMKE